MNILVIQPCADKRGHFGVYTVNLCQELTKRGNTVTLFTNKVFPEKFIPDEKPLFDIIEYAGGKYGVEKLDAVKNTRPIRYAWGYIRNSFLILRAAIAHARKNKFDTIQILDTEYGIVSLLLHIYGKGLPKTSLLINAPNFSFKEFTGPFVIKLYKEFQRRLLKSVFGKYIQGIVTIGEFHKGMLREQFNLSESFPITVIYDGAKLPTVFIEKQLARTSLDINFDGTIFLLFGMIRKDKGIEYLLEAVSLIKEQNFKVVIVGSLFDYTQKELDSLVNRFDIHDKVILRIGYIENKDIPSYFFASDALILPYISLYRGGSGPLLKEAAIHKVPAIVSDVSEMGLLVKKHSMGLIATPEDPVSLADAMKSFMQLSEEERKLMGERGFAAASTWSQMGEYYEKSYRNL